MMLFRFCFAVLSLLSLAAIAEADVVTTRTRVVTSSSVVRTAPRVRVAAPVRVGVVVVPQRLPVGPPLPAAPPTKFTSSTTQTLTTPTGTRTFSSTVTQEGAVDALDEVNAARARRGLRPFIHDPLLTIGARTIAVVRARQRIAGHTANDFTGLPAGASARASGCAAWEPSWGWGSCATYENFTYAGAAYAMGADGRRYMQLFVR